MTKYIGLDVHATSCTMAVINEAGRKLQHFIVETNEQAMADCLRSIPGPRRLCLEEGTQSSWLYEVLSAHADEVVVAGTTDKKKGPKNDLRDAIDMAQRLRTGSLEQVVFKSPRVLPELRQLARHYLMITRDLTRTQLRLNSLYRSRGIPTRSKTLYSYEHRNEWIAKLNPACRSSADLLYVELDALTQLKRDATKRLVSESHRHPISRILETCPGLAGIRVALLLPIVAVPERFRTARQFWSYCGLGIVMRVSSEWEKQGPHWVRAQVKSTRGLTRTFNHTLKYVFKGAATTVITKLPDHPLEQHYRRQLAAGTKPNLAKLTLARKIAATTLAMWKHQEEYDPERHHNA
jgi:transposase